MTTANKHGLSEQNRTLYIYTIIYMSLHTIVWLIVYGVYLEIAPAVYNLKLYHSALVNPIPITPYALPLLSVAFRIVALILFIKKKNFFIFPYTLASGYFAAMLFICTGTPIFVVNLCLELIVFLFLISSPVLAAQFHWENRINKTLLLAYERKDSSSQDTAGLLQSVRPIKNTGMKAIVCLAFFVDSIILIAVYWPQNYGTEFDVGSIALFSVIPIAIISLVFFLVYRRALRIADGKAKTQKSSAHPRKRTVAGIVIRIIAIIVAMVLSFIVFAFFAFTNLSLMEEKQSWYVAQTIPETVKEDILNNILSDVLEDYKTDISINTFSFAYNPSYRGKTADGYWIRAGISIPPFLRDKLSTEEIFVWSSRKKNQFFETTITENKGAEGPATYYVQNIFIKSDDMDISKTITDNRDPLSVVCNPTPLYSKAEISGIYTSEFFFGCWAVIIVLVFLPYKRIFHKKQR